MGFYGEIINTGDSPFTFDKIYSSRYHMEQAMAEDGIYSGRFVLISYDSSYMHNNFKRAYIKEEDKNKKSAITLYRDSTCNKPILYKDFDDESENAGDSLAATLANVYYVKDDYFYTYYKCVDKNNDIAVFDYYTEMNTLYKEAFRDDKSMDASKIRLYLDKEHKETIKTYKQDAKNGVYKGDIVFVRETALEQSAQEKSEGVFSYYECTDAENGDALFEKIAQIIGHFKDETLENYIMNQKLDSMYYGLEGGVHNYDKTVWQKVYIGEKEQYIKIASLNSEIPKLNISVDAPEATISTAPYFDTDVNGAVEDLHIQPQWGFRIAAANKALSSFGATENTGTGNYVGYVDVVKNESNDFCEQLLLLQDERIRNREASKNFVSTSLSEYLNQNQLSSNNSSVSLKTFEDVLNGNFQPIIDNVNNYLFSTEETIIYPEYIKDYSLEQDAEKIYYIYNDVTNSYDIIEFTSDEESISYSPGVYYYRLKNTPQENLFLKCAEYYDQYDIKSDAVFDPDILVDELTYGPIDDEIFYNQDGFSFVEELSNQDYYNLILLGYDNIEETILPNLFEYFNQFIRLLDNYAVSLKTINSGFNNNVIKLSWNSSFKVRSVLNLIFDFPFEKETALVNGQENSEETYNPSILQTPFVKQETVLDENNKEEVVNNIIKDILEIVDEYSSIESDEDIIWKAKKGDSSYSTFNGYEWVDSKESFPGAIYYNKAGFDPKINTKSETKDYINITPSGFSQVYDAGEDIWSNKKYTNPNSDFTAEKIEAPDVQELSIHLPSIGNAVSDMWDIVYGEGENDENGKKIRKTNIDWDISGESYNDRLRLVQDGNERGVTYSPENVATLAGVINSVQDLMGRIIVDDFNNFTTTDDEELTSKNIEDNLNSNTIYYFSDDQKYYSVKNKYDFESEYPEEKKIRTEKDYLEKVQGYSLATDLIDPNNMKPNLYYYDSTTLRYIYEKQYIRDEAYVTLEPEEVNFASNPNVDEYLLDNENNLIKPNDNGWGNGEYYNLTNKIIGPTYLFIPGEYYIDNPNYDPNVANGENQYIAPTYFDPSKIYYVRKGESSIGKNPITGEIIPATNIMEPVYYPKPAENEIDLYPNLHIPLLTINKDHSSQNLVYNCYIKASKDISQLSDLFAGAQFSTAEFDSDVVENSYRRLLEEVPFGDADIIPADDQNNNDRIFYGVLTSDFNQENIIPKYEKDTYYYKVQPVADGSIYYYQLDTSEKGEKSKRYYKLNNIINQKLELYESGKYYIRTSDGVYIKNIGDFDSNTEYYKHNIYYVTKDYEEVYKRGQMWDYTLPWKEYLLDNSNEIGSTIVGIDDLNTSIKQYKNYYYDSEGRHPVNFIESFDSSKYYKLVNDSNYELVGDGVEYDPNIQYFIKLTKTSTSNIFTDSSGKIYKTTLINGILYNITEYESDYQQNLDKLPIINVKNGNYYLPQIFEAWEAGKYYWENDYSEAIIGSDLIKEEDLNEIYYFEELEGFSRKYNTINGLILSFNKALGSKNSDSRDLNTLYGCINRLNDEIRRLQIYDSSAISMITNSILSSFQTAKDLADEIINIRQQVSGAYGELLTESEAVKYYANINDFNSIIGFNLDNGRGTNQDNTSGILLYNPLTGRQIKGFENPNNSIIGEITDINKRTAKTDVLTNLLGLELTEDKIVTDFNKATTDKLNLPKIIEDGVSISPNISQSINHLYSKIDNIESSLYGHGNNKVTTYNLTNSAWTFKETIPTDSLTGEVFNITFKCNGVTYQKLNIGINNIKYDDTWAYSSDGGWFSNKEKIIITGGTDVKNQNLYEWLNEVAVATTAPTAEEKELESYFGPGSNLIAELESLNENGLLARMAVLDSNIDKLSDNLKDKVTTLRTDYQTNVMNQVINVTPSGGGGSSSGGSTDGGSNNQTGTVSGKELSKPIIVDSLDSSYGFRYSNSQFLWSQDEIKYTLNYEIKLYFSPTTAKTFTDLPVLKLKEFGSDGGILFNRAHYLTIKNDDGSPNLDAYIAYDGTIYVSCKSTMQAVSPAAAYEYTLSGSIVEQLYEYENGIKKLKSENALTIYFGNDKGVLASYSNFPTIAQTFTNTSGSFFNISKAPTPPKGYKFKCWRLCDNSTNKNPVKENGKYIDYDLTQMVDTQVTVSEKDSDWTKIYDTTSNKLKGNYFVPIYESDGSEVYIVDGVYYNCAKGTSVKTFAANTKWKLVQSAKTTGKTSAAYYLTTSVKYSRKTSKKIKYNGSSSKKQKLYILKNRWGGKVKSTGTALNKIFTTSVQDKNSNSGCWYRTMKATPISSTKSYYLINQN